MELAAALAIIPEFRIHLINSISKENKTLVKDIIPRFRDTLNTYPATNYGYASPDFILINFIRKVKDLSLVNKKFRMKFLSTKTILDNNCFNKFKQFN